MSGVIRVDDPAKLAAALDEVRQMLGINRSALARHIAEQTGREAHAVRQQLLVWTSGKAVPYVTSLGPVLDALGYDLALVPKEEPR